MNDRHQGTLTLLGLLHAADAVASELESRLAAAGLSLAKLAALQALADAGRSVPLSDLAERLSCVKSNITQLVDRLEADSYVRRTAHPLDRRTRLAVLTAAGRKACREGTRIQQQAERDLLKTLTGKERGRLAALLDKLARSRSRAR
jgi:DNA-binding MarR family transcriptional regulator